MVELRVLLFPFRRLPDVCEDFLIFSTMITSILPSCYLEGLPLSSYKKGLLPFPQNSQGPNA